MTHAADVLQSPPMKATFGTVRCPLLIGRNDLVELAERRLDDVARGHGQLLLVSGEPGIGKSRLLQAVTNQATERGFATAWGYVAPQDGDVPAASIMDLAREMLRIPAFADLGAELLRARDVHAESSTSGRRRIALEMVDRILLALPSPTLLGFEDLQWADDLSLDVIGELGRRSRETALLVAGAYRVGEMPLGSSLRDWRARLVNQRIAEELRLRPLTPEQTALVTSLILDTGLPAPREVAEAVHARTDGIPLHIEELLGALEADALVNGRAIREAVVPDTIEDAVLSRLRHRSGEAQAAAHAGAVIGRCFTIEVLAGIMDVPPADLEAPLQELVDAQVLDPPGARGLFDFRHQLLRDAIYGDVSVGERRRYHARAGEFGARLEGQSQIHASAHFERAGMRREAFDAALAGAREAARISLHREAFDLYRRAVANMPDDLDPVEQGAILAAFASEAASVEEHDTAERAAAAGADAYRRAGDPVAAIGAVIEVPSLWRRECRPIDERRAGIGALLAELAEHDETPDALAHRISLTVDLAIVETDARAMTEARRLLDAARLDAERLGNAELRTEVDWKAGVADMVAGSMSVGLERVGDIAKSAERAGWESIGVSAFRDAATYAAAALDYGTAARWIDEGLRYADSIQQSHCAHVMGATSAIVAWADGDWGSAEDRAKQAVADPGCARATETARWALGAVALGRGDYESAAAEFEAARTFGLTSQDVSLILPPAWGLAEVDLMRGDADDAVRMSREAFELARRLDERPLFVPFVVTGVRAAIAAGRPADGRAWVDACAEHLDAISDVAAPALDHGRGLVALADGATGVARAALEAAVAGWDARPRIWEATWARLDLASALIRASHFAEALPLAVEARTTASRIGSRPLADRADDVMRLARGRVATEEPWRPLTAREFEVARLVGEGRTNLEIADELGIAPKTASSHVEHILAKLGASRRAEIATWASHVERRSLVN
jgi:DNA-binding CsgD family transcriptional regulator/tetratricopeptide (TPR) repeat protein